MDSEPSEALDFVDTDGDRIAFIVNASGRMDYIVNQRVKVRNLSRLSIRHRTIYLDGESAGTWSSSRFTTVPEGQDSILQRAESMFAHAH